MNGIVQKIIDKVKGTNGIVCFEEDIQRFQIQQLKKRAKLVAK